MRTGLVMEGGSFRGLFTSGILDVFMENNVEFDGCIGTSAGATFGCNYKSGQIGRSIRYNLRFCKDPRFLSIRSLIFTGNAFNREFAYERLPMHLDVFDTDAYAANPMKFYVVCTDVETGKAVYHECEKGDMKDIEWMRASSSMPFFSQIVEIDGQKMLDGGVADSVALKAFQNMGYDRNVVILTQPRGYKKGPNRLLPVMGLSLVRYPKMIEAIKNRHLLYNETIEYIDALEESGDILVLRPDTHLPAGRLEHDPEKLKATYELGREMGLRRLQEVTSFLCNTSTALSS